MNHDDARFWVGMICGTLFGFLVVGMPVAIVADRHSARQEQEKAIKANVGRWTIDPETGRTSFIYGK